MIMRVGVLLTLILLLLAHTIPTAFSTEYLPNSVTVTLYADGTATVTYTVDSDPTRVKTTVTLFGETFTDLLVTNENYIPLVASISGSNITVDSIGAAKINFSYSTPELTSKIGILWTLNMTSSTNLIVVMPSGATIVSVSQIPLNIKTVNERTQITLPSGNIQISYVVSTTVARDHAQAIIDDAETTINSVKAKGIVTTEADTLLIQAKAALTAVEYLRSEQLAAQAKTSAQNTESLAQAASSAIQQASSALQTARNEARTSTLTEAEGFLAEAESLETSGDYLGAKTNADKAYASATSSTIETNYTVYLVVGAATLIIAALGIILYNKWRSTSSTKKVSVKPTPTKKTEDGDVNLEAIFKKHQDLRVDDKEVLRFLAERSGEAFANEIRDRFDIPRTSSWRLIRRLISLGIVEEKKIGGQSLIYVVKKYREVQE